MFSKFHWGHGITIFYIIFVGVVVTALIASFSVDHSLVVDDYYATDLAYQSRYDKTKNSLQSQMLHISKDADLQETTIGLKTEKPVKGKAQWYRPSDQSADFIVELKGNETIVSTDELLKGKWILKVEWTIEGKTSYAEEQIFVD
ncbi:MAG: nitrogen fixation protein FixH [Saprospiraceae bacterium]|jgi:nitrogen fixation protein FixH